MLNQLALASVMVVITVMVHLVGLNMVMRLLRSHSRFIRKLRITPLTLLLSASLGIFAIHTLEIWLYAALFLGLGAFNDFEAALYFSTSTYAAIGYGDLLMPYGWRVLGAIEGATGIIMFGWSTAFLVSLLAKLNLFRHDWLAPKTTSRSNIKDCLHRAGILGVRTGAAEVPRRLIPTTISGEPNFIGLQSGAMQPSIHVSGFDAAISQATPST